MPIANAAPATTVADPVNTLYHKITWKLIPFLCFCYLAPRPNAVSLKCNWSSICNLAKPMLMRSR